MKSILLGIFVFISVLSSGQTNPALPFPVQGKWVYHTLTLGSFWKDEFPEVQPYIFDTIDSYHFLGEPWICVGMDIGQVWLGDKWITQNGNSWYLNSDLYVNWDMQEGDTIYFPFPNVNGDYLVSNIDTIVTPDNISRRTYHLLVVGGDVPYVPYPYGVEFYFIEGIGATVYGLETGYHEDINILTCFYDKNGLEIYHQDYPDYGVYDCCNIVGVEEEESTSIQLFPSPANDHITLQFGNGPLPTEVKIFNALGTLVHREAVNGRQQLQLNTSNFASGVYTVVAQGADGVVGKFVRE